MAIRYDTGQLAEPVKLDNGYLRADGIITRTGVFSYLLPSGTVRKELRLPDEVFQADALSSFKMSPLTNNHPAERLTSKNTKKHQVGSITEVGKSDESLVKASILVTDDAAISDAEGGKRQLSCGYTCDLDMTPGMTIGIPGVKDGLHFDAIQRNIRGNHVALVDKGRAGPEASIHLDADDAIQVDDGYQPTQRASHQGTDMKIKIDGVDYEVTDQAHQAITKVMTVATETAAQVATLKEDMAKLKAKADKADEDLKAAQTKADAAVSPDVIKAAVAARVLLEQHASKILGVKDADGKPWKLDVMDDGAIKRHVILTVSPAAADKLDAGDDAYINARFDQAVEGFKGDTTTDTAKPLPALNRMRDPDGGRTDADKDTGADAARERMVVDGFNAGRKPLQPSKSN